VRAALRCGPHAHWLVTVFDMRARNAVSGSLAGAFAAIGLDQAGFA
jgi:hypothetical protein